MRKLNLKTTIFTLILLFPLIFTTNSFAEIIRDGSGKPNWKNPQAYRPYPVLLLHGFAKGSPQSWTDTGIDRILNGFFKQYNTDYNPSNPLTLSSTRYPYLEIISFIDHAAPIQELVDRNSSVDTFKRGDYYVAKKLRPDDISGWAGWSDKLDNAVSAILANYKTNKLLLVAHSMGGLAAREYITNNSGKYGASYLKVRRLVTVDTPNLGTDLASLATLVSETQSDGWLNVVTSFSLATKLLILGLDSILINKAAIDIRGDAERDMNPVSDFLSSLNSRDPHYADVSYFAIIGKDQYLFGDGIVDLDSQRGILALEGEAQITTNHFLVPEAAGYEILKFLDSTKPEIEITSPDPAQTIEIQETSIHIKGKAYKEYLPADTILTINVIRQGDLYALPPQNSVLMPSNLWVSNDLNSPVAEFEQTINFPGNGIYKISCRAKNAAGIASDIKDVWVKVAVPQEAGLIVHCHNPEGKEIASIQGMDRNSVEIYDGDTLIGHGAHDAATHNQPIKLPSGNHTIKAKFNGMTQEQAININPNETQQIIFTFSRTEFNLKSWIDSFAIEQAVSVGGSFEFNPSSPENLSDHNHFDFFPDDVYGHDGWVDVWFSAQKTYVGGGSWTDPEAFGKFDWSQSAYAKFNNHESRIEYTVNSDYVGNRTVIVGADASAYNAGQGLRPNRAPFAPATSLFTSWFAQSIRNGFYPDLWVAVDDRGFRTNLFGGFPQDAFNNYYYLRTLPADKNYLYYSKTGPGVSFQQHVDFVKEFHAHSSNTKSGTLDEAKISSVPYDLTGSGV